MKVTVILLQYKISAFNVSLISVTNICYINNENCMEKNVNVGGRDW